MTIQWAWLLATCAIACASSEHGPRGSSLRGALEALQRRQRGRNHEPIMSASDYEDIYEFLPPHAYPENDYTVDVEDVEDESTPKYIVKLLAEDLRPERAYEYKVNKKNNFHVDSPDYKSKKESAFRERSQQSDNDLLRNIFMNTDEPEDKNNLLERAENDAEYALLLGQLWSKYKHNDNKIPSDNADAPQGVVKLYKEKIVKKRYPDNWGPIAFKKKRSSNLEDERSMLNYDENRNRADNNNRNYNAYELSDNDKDDVREEYAIAFQPIDDESLSDILDEDQYPYDAIEKRFPVTKRSSGPYISPKQKRFTPDQSKREISKSFRSNTGTDPRVLMDLSKIFGEPEIIKSPVKRSSDHDETSHDIKPPNLTILGHNDTEQHNLTQVEEDSHEHNHAIHHPGLSGEKIEYNSDHDHHPDSGHDHTHNHNHDHEHNHENSNSRFNGHDHEHKHDHHHEHGKTEKPLNIKKKSIDWSDYFGIDKRFKKSVSFVNDLNQDRLRKQYFDTFNKEVIYPVNSFRKHVNVKRNLIQPKPNEETEIQIDRAQAVAIRNDNKRTGVSDNDSKLDNIDKKLRNMEGLIVDEALHFSNVGEKLDSKEEQEMKEKLLSRLAAAYSLEKMRKALKEFKQSLQAQKAINMKLAIDNEELKSKRVAVKKEKAIPTINDVSNYLKDDDKMDDFEDEQGAGHYLNGKIEEQLSEGYMGGSGRHRSPMITNVGSTGPCPVLAKIIQRCRGVDLLAGDRGQLFLPHCSLHQICYLCGEAPPTTCDLVFLSEADTTCEGDMSCQRAARSALMALRELHDNLADELDGECEASPCLAATLKLNIGWQRALNRNIMASSETRDTEGIDNPVATKDNGDNLRPDLVISVQPQSQESSRAELPVSTMNWQSRSGGQFIPMHGLDFLIGTSSLLIQQTVELNDLTSKIDSENRYTIKVPNGEALYFASEVSTSTQRCLCGTGRSFTMHLHDNTRQEAMVLHRRLAAASCLFPCRLQEMTVVTPPGNYVGRVHQQWTWMVPFYLVRDANDNVLFVIEGPATLTRSALLLSEFKILSGDSLREVGKISHGWDRELVNFTTTLVFPETAVQPKHKALLLAATFLLEYTYFERAKSSCLRLNCL
ncbi:uncharacterized protein [Battus philenor]|uniref:uncharacterized protein n=1 Tax=Battus philenor TaxID=42288 RepID=UPI0035D08C1E